MSANDPRANMRTGIPPVGKSFPELLIVSGSIDQFKEIDSRGVQTPAFVIASLRSTDAANSFAFFVSSVSNTTTISLEPVRAGKAHSRGRQISGSSKQWAAMFRLRPVRGPGFMQGRGGSGRRERLVPTLHGEARLGIRLSLARSSRACPAKIASRPGNGTGARVDVRLGH